MKINVMSLFFQVPRIFVQGECLGGCSEVKKLFESGKLAEIIEGE
jgi:glutaredoxin-related protein